MRAHPTDQPCEKPPASMLETMLARMLRVSLFVAAWGAIASQVPGLRRLYHKGAAQEALEGAAIGAGIGAIFGAMEGAAHQGYHAGVEHARQESSHRSFTDREAEKQDTPPCPTCSNRR